MALAVNVEAVARPAALVVTTQEVGWGLPPEQAAKVPDGPEEGAVKVTATPARGLPWASVTSATRGDEKAVETGVDCGEPEETTTEATLPVTVQQ